MTIAKREGERDIKQLNKLTITKKKGERMINKKLVL